MEIIKGTYGCCYIQDNHLGLQEALKNHEHYDLTFTDLPYNDMPERCSGMNDSKTPRKTKSYDTKISKPKYRKMLKDWFELNKQLSKRIIFFCGKRNLGFWQNYDPIFEDQWGLWRIANSQSRGYISKFIRFEPILFYGNYKERDFKWDYDIFYYADNGFMNKSEFTKSTSVGLIDPDPDYTPVHPHIKPYLLVHDFIIFYHPKSFLDCWMGSGINARICEMYKIPWRGYEINSEFIPDIKWNIAVGQANVREFPKGIPKYLQITMAKTIQDYKKNSIKNN